MPVADLRTRRRLGVDIDGPLDLVLLGGRWASHLDAADVASVVSNIEAVRRIADDPRAELLVAGRVSAANVAWLERETASRTRVLIEERGLRTRRAGQRPAASVLGAILERDGPGSLGGHRRATRGRGARSTVACSSRIAAARTRPGGRHRRTGSLPTCCSPDRVADPWLQALTRSAAEARVPILLGGHTLVGPGLPLALRRGSIASVRDRLPTRAPSRAPCRSVRPRRRSRACRAHPSGDPCHGADAVRSLHGARALRPRWWLLPLPRGTPGPRRRLHHGARAPSDLRRAARACGRRRLGDPRSTGTVQRRGARCRRGCAGRADARGAAAGAIGYHPVEVDERRVAELRQRLADAVSANASWPRCRRRSMASSWRTRCSTPCPSTASVSAATAIRNLSKCRT